MTIRINGEKIVLTVVELALLLMAYLVYNYFQQPKVVYTCKVYRIDSTQDTITYVGRTKPSPPHWSRHYGWSSDFEDETICRYELLKTDTLWEK